MTNAEIIERQRAARAHQAAVPGALDTARAALVDLEGQAMGNDDPPRCSLRAGHLRTLLAEIDRLQLAVKRLNEDLRDEAREAGHSAASAYSEGRHDGMSEARGF